MEELLKIILFLHLGSPVEFSYSFLRFAFVWCVYLAIELFWMMPREQFNSGECCPTRFVKRVGRALGQSSVLKRAMMK